MGGHTCAAAASVSRSFEILPLILVPCPSVGPWGQILRGAQFEISRGRPAP